MLFLCQSSWSCSLCAVHNSLLLLKALCESFVRDDRKVKLWCGAYAWEGVDIIQGRMLFFSKQQSCRYNSRVVTVWRVGTILRKYGSEITSTGGHLTSWWDERSSVINHVFLTNLVQLLQLAKWPYLCIVWVNRLLLCTSFLVCFASLICRSSQLPSLYVIHTQDFSIILFTYDLYSGLFAVT